MNTLNTKKHTILWADDDPDDLALMREIMQSTDHDFNIIEVDNGRKVLDYLHSVKQHRSFPCLIILDMNMPVLSGRETLAFIKADPALCNIPVVVFTTSNSELDKLFCKRYGVEMMTKPPNYTSLRQVIQTIISFCVYNDKDTSTTERA
jgi:CheY-like chemotaxis protein